MLFSLMFRLLTHFGLGDTFKEAAQSMMRSEVKDGHIKAGHDKAFKPAKTV